MIYRVIERNGAAPVKAQIEASESSEWSGRCGSRKPSGMKLLAIKELTHHAITAKLLAIKESGMAKYLENELMNELKLQK